MLWLDRQYISQTSHMLRNFRWSASIANFSCPFCGDSKKDTKKARGYCFPDKVRYIYKCHNCNKSTNIYNLLLLLSPETAKQYVVDRFKAERGLDDQRPEEPAEEKKFVAKSTTILGECFERVSDLEPSHPASAFVRSRRIPIQFHKNLFYVPKSDDLAGFIPEGKTKTLGSTPRLLIPFLNRTGDLVGMTCRDLTGISKMRYLTVKFGDHPLIYGLDKLNMNTQAIVVEGPIDSMFLPNCIASGGLNFELVFPYVDKQNTIFVPDNEYRNNYVVKSLQNLIANGYKIFIYPDSIRHKDINDCVCAGLDMAGIIPDYSYSGLAAKLKLTQKINSLK